MLLNEFSRFFARWQTALEETTSIWQTDDLPNTDSYLSCVNFYQKQGVELADGLRRARNAYLLDLMRKDLAGASLETVGQSMSELAQASIQLAFEQVQKQLVDKHGEPTDEHGKSVPLLVVGMGKLGGRELNVSSDIDLIFVYAEDGQTNHQRESARLSNHEFFARVVRRGCNLLHEVTPHGFVFRVDTRLRPNGDSGPAAVSLAMLEEYFSVQGREWERFAWLKSRVLNRPANDVAANQLKHLVEPFVYRRYMDFGVLESLRELHGQIRRQAEKKLAQRHDLGEDLKLGRGGIREIEFIVQMLQIVRGGRYPMVRSRNTLHALQRLVEQEVMTAAVATALAKAYRFLRQLEHRVQYLDDAQTHCLPNDSADLERLAWAMQLPSVADLLTELATHQALVASEFERSLGATQATGSSAQVARRDIAEEVEKAQMTLSHARLQALLQAPRYRQLSEKGRDRLQKILLTSFELCQRYSAPDLAMARLIDVLEAIGRRESYLAYLQEQPKVLAHLLDLLAASSWAASYVQRHPSVMDELVGEMELAFDANSFRKHAQAEREFLARRGQDDTGECMDILRRLHQTEVFRILLRDLRGALSVEQVADQLSLLADTQLQISLDWLWPELQNAHRPTPRFAVIAYGKLGGKELGYGGDLDIVFLFDDDHPDAQEVYSKLTRRLISWLTTQTACGRLYEIDMRLRPNGSDGLLVTTLAAFARYQQGQDENSAWTWEHQALTRARFCAGDAELGQRFELLRRDILCGPRNAEVLRKEILQMRARMRQELAPKDGHFDLKHSPGGMVDIEFAAQFLVLAYAHQFPQLANNLGCIALLQMAQQVGIVPGEVGKNAADVYRELRRLQHRARLNDEAQTPASHEQLIQQTQATQVLLQALNLQAQPS